MAAELAPEADDDWAKLKLAGAVAEDAPPKPKAVGAGADDPNSEPEELNAGTLDTVAGETPKLG